MTTAVNIAAHKTEALLFFTLLQLTVIVLAARIGGGIALRIGQSAVVGEIVIGILLGPSLFGLLAPDVFQYVFHSGAPEPMQMLSQIGLVLLMFQIGLEFDFSHLGERRNRTAVMWVASASLVVPFALGFAVGQISAPILSPGAHALGSALFVATAFSITALPILGRIMMEFDMTRTPIGVSRHQRGGDQRRHRLAAAGADHHAHAVRFQCRQLRSQSATGAGIFPVQLVWRASANEAHPASLRCTLRRAFAQPARDRAGGHFPVGNDHIPARHFRHLWRFYDGRVAA